MDNFFVTPQVFQRSAKRMFHLNNCPGVPKELSPHTNKRAGFRGEYDPRKPPPNTPIKQLFMRSPLKLQQYSR